MSSYFPNTDTSTIRRDERGYWRIGPSKRPLCGSCTIFPCEERARIVGGDLFDIEIEGCRIFTPVLGFSVLAGLDLAQFNTFRMGDAWMNRLMPSDNVGIVDLRNQRILRLMSVAGLDNGTLDQMLERHAHNNHAQLEAASLTEDPETINHPASLWRILRNAYGSRIAEKSFTVISLVEAI